MNARLRIVEKCSPGLGVRRPRPFEMSSVGFQSFCLCLVVGISIAAQTTALNETRPWGGGRTKQTPTHTCMNQHLIGGFDFVPDTAVTRLDKGGKRIFLGNAYQIDG